MYFSSLFTGSYIIDGINFQNIKRGVGWLLTLRNNCRYLHVMSGPAKILHSFVLTLLIIIMRNCNWFRSHLLQRKAKCVNDESIWPSLKTYSRSLNIFYKTFCRHWISLRNQFKEGAHTSDSLYLTLFINK